MSDHLSHGFCRKKAALLTAGAYIPLHLGSCSMAFSLRGSVRGRHSGEGHTSVLIWTLEYLSARQPHMLASRPHSTSDV